MIISKLCQILNQVLHHTRPLFSEKKVDDDSDDSVAKYMYIDIE